MKIEFRALLFGAVFYGIGISSPPSIAAQSADLEFKETEALAVSQTAIGKAIGDYSFRTGQGKTVRLNDFLGKPLVLNFIYTGCAQSCNVNTAWLVEVFDTAQEALGEDSFSAVTIGFDTRRDTPGRMQSFANQRGADGIQNWHFLSGDAESVGQLAKTVGFSYFKSAQGFDHIDQVTIIDAEGLVQAQIYGETFEKPALIDPLKNMVFGTATPYRSLDDLIKKVRLFCTIYDPATERYKFDYSLFIQLGVGGVFIGAVMIFLVRDQLEQRRRRRKKHKQQTLA